MAAGPPQLSVPVNATKEDLDPQRTYSGPSLLVHPDDPETIVAGTIEFRQKHCLLMRSTNGGQSWRFLDNPPVLQSYPFCLHNNSNAFQAPLAWGRNSNLYMLSVGWDIQDSRNKTSIVLHRSADAGNTWTSTLVRDARATEKDGVNEMNRPVTDLVVDRSNGNEDIIYVTYRRNWNGTTTGNARPSMPMVAVSTDGGRSFVEPATLPTGLFEEASTRDRAIRTTTTVPATTTTTAPAANTLAAQPNQVANFGGSNPSITIDDDGNVYAAWKSTSANVTPSPPPGIFLSKSTDRGKSWTVSEIRPFSYENGSVFIIPYVRWSDEGGPNGTLHLVYEGTDRPAVASFSTIYYMRSTDGGKTWTNPRPLPDTNPDEFKGAFIPNMTIAPNGRVDVAWWDTRDDPGIRANDVYYTYSTDNGATWAKNIRVTDQSIDRRFGVWGNNFDQNSPVGMASINEYAIFGWDDTRLSRGEGGPVRADDPVSGGVGIGGGLQDIFISTVQFEAVGGGTSTAAKVVLAGVVGLLAVGLILLAVSLASRKGTEGTLAETPTKMPADIK